MKLKKQVVLVCTAIMAAGVAAGLSACGSFNGILIWGPEEHEQVYKDAIELYKQTHPDFNYEVRFAAQGDAGANANVAKDVESAGSIVTFPNDQLISLKRTNALSKLSDTNVAWAKANHVNAAVEAGKIGDGYYAYPISADNGFVMIYNRKAFEGTSVWDTARNTFKIGYTFRDLYKALDEKEAQDPTWKDAKVIWPSGSAWYESGVFFATGGDYSVEYDEKGIQTKATCNFGYNLTESGEKDFTNGLNAIRAMMNTMTEEDGKVSRHFAYTDDTDPAYNDYVSDHIGNGSKATTEPLAGVISWNNSALREAWGDNYDVAVLPTLVADSKILGGNGDKFTWRSFSGFKLMGVNPFCAFARQNEKNIEILHDLAKFLSDTQVSLLRYASTSLGPSNLGAQEDDAVKSDKFLKALNEQFNLKDETGKIIGARTQDSTPANFWTPIANIGKAVYEALNGTTGSFDNIINAQRQLAQLQFDIEAAAD